MPSLLTSYVLVAELLILLAGAVLAWRWGLSQNGRSQPVLLPAWEVSLSDFFLFIWLVFLGGLAGEYAVGLYLKYHPRDLTHQLIFGTAGLHVGILLGMAGYRFTFGRRQARLVWAIPAALKSGVVTFLASMPVIWVVSLLWQGALKLCGITLKVQESIELLRNTHAVTLRAALLIVAILVAPISEELIFRAGIFRYVRTRLPRWIALLLPAVLFATLHLDLGSFVPLVALAVVFSLAYEKTGNIGTTIIAHALFNLNATVLVLAGIDT